jgi:hypothetical protein
VAALEVSHDILERLDVPIKLLWISLPTSSHRDHVPDPDADRIVVRDPPNGIILVVAECLDVRALAEAHSAACQLDPHNNVYEPGPVAIPEQLLRDLIVIVLKFAPHM